MKTSGCLSAINISSFICIYFSVHTDLAKVTQRTVEKIDTIEQQSEHKYHAEPSADMPFVPPNTNLTQKAGYLFCRGYDNNFVNLDQIQNSFLVNILYYLDV